MEVPLIDSSNTLSLITWVLGLPGPNFTDKCRSAIEELNARMLFCDQHGCEWHRLLRTKGQVQGFIRHDLDAPFDWYEVQHSVAA